MAVNFSIEISIKVVRDDEAQPIAAENTYFVNQTFKQCANKSDLYYELIAKLEKSK